MTPRIATIVRKTRETDITLTLNLDGTGETSIKTGIGFLDHMLTALARHARFDLTLTCIGDLDQWASIICLPPSEKKPTPLRMYMSHTSSCAALFSAHELEES